MNLLEGIKVVDFSKWLPGQYCGMLLGDYGADVIKIEDLAGDATRKFWPEKAPGMSYWHMMLNRNKRGVALNIKKDGGSQALTRLLAEADDGRSARVALFFRISAASYFEPERVVVSVSHVFCRRCGPSMQAWPTLRVSACMAANIQRERRRDMILGVLGEYLVCWKLEEYPGA